VGRWPKLGRLERGAAAGADQQKKFKLRKYPFVIQFAWQPQPRGERQVKAAQKKAAAAAAVAAPAEAPTPSS